jgi:hypothetical protein
VAENAQIPVDLSAIRGNYNFKGGFESPEDAEAKRREDAENARHKRRERFIVVCFTLIMVSLIFLGCFYEYATGSADDKKWSGALIAGICGSFVGYVVRHAD